MGFFSNLVSSGSQKSTAKPKKRDQRKGVDDQEGISNTQMNNIIKAEVDQQLYKYRQPTQQRGMTDLIANHSPENDFPFISIVGKDKETFSTKVQRLLRLHTQVTRKEIEGIKALSLALTKDTEKISLSAVIKEKGLPYLYLSKATCHFTPMTSFLDGYSECVFSLIDTRMLHNQVRQQVKSGTNLQTPMEFSMDHCVPRSSASKLQLCVARTQPNMVMGEQWGYVEISLEVEESDKPFIENTREVAAAAQLPSTGLEKFERDPTTLNIQLHENHRIKLQEIYEAGKILDINQPQTEKLAAPVYAKSSGAGLKAKRSEIMAPQMPGISETMKPDVGNWDIVRSSGKKDIPDDQVSYSVPDDDTESIEPVRSNGSVENFTLPPRDGPARFPKPASIEEEEQEPDVPMMPPAVPNRFAKPKKSAMKTKGVGFSLAGL
jgi:hypothetical protein